MTDQKKALQDDELESVNGGTEPEPSPYAEEITDRGESRSEHGLDPL